MSMSRHRRHRQQKQEEEQKGVRARPLQGSPSSDVVDDPTLCAGSQRALRCKGAGVAWTRWRLRLLLVRLQVTAEYKHRVQRAGGGGSEQQQLLRTETLHQVERGRGGVALVPRPRVDFCPRSEGPDNSNSAATKQASSSAAQPAGGATLSKRGEGSPSPTVAPAASAAAMIDPDVLKTVRVSMGPLLGDFVVKVYTDAFLITNLNDGIKMEISNVGRPVVMVKETGGVGVDSSPSSSSSGVPRVLTADSSRHSVDRCTVRVSRRKKKTGFSVGLIWERYHHHHHHIM